MFHFNSRIIVKFKVTGLDLAASILTSNSYLIQKV